MRTTALFLLLDNMNRFFSISFILLALVISAAGAAPAAHAQDGPTGESPPLPPPSEYVGDFAVDPNAGTPEAVAEAAAARQAIQQQTSQTPSPAPGAGTKPPS